MLHNDHGVVLLLQFAQHVYEFVGIATVQVDAWLVEDIYRTYERTSKVCREVDALALAAAQCVRRAVEREVAQAYVLQELQSAGYLVQQSLGNLLLVAFKHEVVEPCLQVVYRLLYKFGYAHASNFHPRSLWAQTCAVTFRAYRLATIAAEQHAILNLMLVLLHHLEEGVDAYLLSWT